MGRRTEVGATFTGSKDGVRRERGQDLPMNLPGRSIRRRAAVVRVVGQDPGVSEIPLQGEDGGVVLASVVLEIVDPIGDDFAEPIDGLGAIARQQLGEPPGTEEFPVWSHRFRDAIGVEDPGAAGRPG